jgi:hypothetical protein
MPTRATRAAAEEAHPVQDQRQSGAIGKISGQKLSVHVVSIDFELIPNQKCRERFWTMATSWNLDRKSIDDLVRLPFIMLGRSPDLKNVYRDAHVGNANDQHLRQPADFPVDYSKVCS